MKKETISVVDEWINSLSDLEYLNLYLITENDEDKILIVFKNRDMFNLNQI